MCICVCVFIYIFIYLFIYWFIYLCMHAFVHSVIDRYYIYIYTYIGARVVDMIYYQYPHTKFPCGTKRWHGRFLQALQGARGFGVEVEELTDEPWPQGANPSATGQQGSDGGSFIRLHVISIGCSVSHHES